MQIQKGKKKYKVLMPGDPWDGEPGYVGLKRAEQWIADGLAKALGKMKTKKSKAVN